MIFLKPRPADWPKAPRFDSKTVPPATQNPTAGAPPQAGTPAVPRRPRPYSQVITDRAQTEHGGITVHRVDDKWFFEVPDSLLNRDIQRMFEPLRITEQFLMKSAFREVLFRKPVA